MESYLEKNSAQDDSERNEIRAELSKMSFEELEKLKAKLGQKLLREAMFGAQPRQTVFKRKNKNRPMETSSKVKPKVKAKVKDQICDPRFDRLCGKFSEKHFQNVYGFILDIKKKEKLKLKKMLKKEEDPEEANKIKYLVQRIENQEREENRRRKQQENYEKEREEQINALNSGKKPYFKTKYEKKIVKLVDKYTDLKKKGKIEKYIEKKQKQITKSKKKRYFEAKISDNEE